MSVTLYIYFILSFGLLSAIAIPTCDKANRYAQCCISSSNSVRCLPNFIVAGTQKSGTTALSALLLGHPSIQFPLNKEVHFFDNEQKYKKGPMYYRRFFPAFNTSNCLNGENSLFPLNGESTPFYIASRLSCERIAATVPNTKMIILLREPISRMKSEYLMKKRRVENQNSFLDMLVEHGNALHECMVRILATRPGKGPRPVKGMTNIADCVPTALSHNTKWDKFATEVQNTYATARLPWTDVIQKCFDNSVNSTLVAQMKGIPVKHRRRPNRRILISPNMASKANTSTSTSTRGSKGIAKESRDQFFPDALEGDKHASNSTNSTAAVDGRQLLLGFKSSGLSSSMFGSRAVNWSFRPKDCLSAKFSAEVLNPIHVSFSKELEDLLACSKEKGILNDGELGNVEQWNEVVDKCLKIKKGITVQYLYRSMYAVQLHHCLKVMPFNQFLVLTSEELKYQPTPSLQKILAFLGLSSSSKIECLLADRAELQGLNAGQWQHKFRVGDMVDMDLGRMSGQVEQAIAKEFPTFEARTGWRFNSSSEVELTDEIHNPLQNFLTHQNKLLFELLSSVSRDLTGPGPHAGQDTVEDLRLHYSKHWNAEGSGEKSP